MYCQSCRYPLAQLSSRTCPECGRAFDPTNPSTFAPTARRGDDPTDFAFVAGLFVAFVAFLFLHMAQSLLLQWWLDTSGWGVRDGSWWVLNPLGEKLMWAQHVIFAAWSVTAGLIVGKRVWPRRRAQRKYIEE